jgi:hypothetical protein
MSIHSQLEIPCGEYLRGHYSSDFRDTTSLITEITTRGMKYNPYNFQAISKISIEVLAEDVISPARTHHCIVQIATSAENPVIHWQKKEITLKEGDLLVLIGSSTTLAREIKEMQRERSTARKISSIWVNFWNKLSIQNVKEIGAFCKNKFQEIAGRAYMIETETVISWGIPIVSTLFSCLAIHFLKNLALSLKAEQAST